MTPGQPTNPATFWLVWCESGGAPTVKHDSYEIAKGEAERLARANRGRRFTVLQAIAHAVVDDVQFVEYGDEIPF